MSASRAVPFCPKCEGPLYSMADYSPAECEEFKLSFIPFWECNRCRDIWNKPKLLIWKRVQYENHNEVR